MNHTLRLKVHLARMFGVAPSHAADLMQHMDPALLQMIHHQASNPSGLGSRVQGPGSTRPGSWTM